MKLALVADSPKSERAIVQQYVDAIIKECAAQAGERISDVRIFYAVDQAQPGGKAPGMTLVRREAPRLLADLDAWRPDSVVSLGGTALNALAQAKKQVTLGKEHGRMRWLELPSGRVPWTPGIEPFRVVKSSDLHRDFANVMYKAIAQHEPLPPMNVDLRACYDIAALRSSLADLEGATVVGVDVETTGFSAFRDGMLAVGFGAMYDSENGIAVVVTRDLLLDPDVDDLMWDAAWRSTRRSVGHNFKFDMGFLRPFIEWPPEGALLGDTLLLHHLLDERPNRPTSRARGSGLKDLVAQRFDYQYGFDFDGGVPEEELPNMYRYLGDDVVYTARLWHELVVEAAAEGGRVMEAHDTLLMPVSVAISKAEQTGAPVDMDWVDETIHRLDLEIESRSERLVRELPPIALTVAVTNLGSASQIAEVVYDEWGCPRNLTAKHGRDDESRSTDEDHVKAIVLWLRKRGDRRSVARADWLEELGVLRKQTKLRTTYIKSLVNRVDTDGRVRPGFLLHGASTGRISAREPAIQTIPAVDDRRIATTGDHYEYKLRDQTWVARPMRRAFAATPEHVIVEVDYSQLELRVAAGLSHDTAFSDVFRNDRDIHLEVAAAIFSKDPAAITKPERYLAKAVSFGILYGRSPGALAGGVEMDYAVEQGLTRWTEPVAAAFISKFLRSYPELQAWSQEMRDIALNDRYVESYRGRRRRFPFFTSRDRGSIARQAVNTPIQAHASDICLQAMVDITNELEVNGALRARVLFPVHDSIVIECHQFDVPDLEEMCRRIMEVEFEGVPLKVDFEYGLNWADAAKDGADPLNEVKP